MIRHNSYGAGLLHICRGVFGSNLGGEFWQKKTSSALPPANPRSVFVCHTGDERNTRTNGQFYLENHVQGQEHKKLPKAFWLGGGLDCGNFCDVGITGQSNYPLGVTVTVGETNY